MITLICSNDPQMAKRACARMVKKILPERNEWNYISFNMSVTMLKDLAAECEAGSFMAEKKVVVADDCAFLAKSKTKYKYLSDDDPQALVDYINNPNDATDLFLLVYSESLDNKNDIVTVLEMQGAIKQVAIPKPEEFASYANKFLASRGVSIDPDALREMIERTSSDYGVFANELEKYALYAPNGRISMEDVKKLTPPKLEDDSFAMSNALIKNDVARAIAIYNDLKFFGYDEIRLISMLANQFRFLEQVYFLDSKGYPTKGIADELGCKPMRVEIALRNLSRVKRQTLEQISEMLYQADKDILTGKADMKFAFLRFLANFDIRN